jgi:hypothetical protein
MLGNLPASDLANELDINSQIPSNGKRKQCDTLCMRDIELNPFRPHVCSQARFALRAIIEFELPWRSIHVPSQQFTQDSPGSDKAISVALKREPIRSRFLVG